MGGSPSRYRVYLHSSGLDTTYGSTWTYDLTGADLLQVIDWAQRQAGDRLTYAIALVLDSPDERRLNAGRGRGLVWLVGMDGNDTTDGCPREQELQRRMLVRRAQPVAVPDADRMPGNVVRPFEDGTEQRPGV